MLKVYKLKNHTTGETLTIKATSFENAQKAYKMICDSRSDELNDQSETIIDSFSVMDKKITSQEVEVELRKRGYKLKNKEEMPYVLEYIEENPSYTIRKWVEDTIRNYPEMLKRIKDELEVVSKTEHQTIVRDSGSYYVYDNQSETIIDSFSVMDKKITSQEVEVELRKRGYKLKNKEEMPYVLEYIEENPSYTIRKWVEDTIRNYPEMLKRI